MCGIAGLIGFRDLGRINDMMGAIGHRGPDDVGSKLFQDSGVALGHTRLSILDLSKAGHQPMTNDSASLWITYNGELYNYREVRARLISEGFVFRSHTDTEVVLKAYEAWGTECLNQFDGMFAFAIYDSRANTLFAARDRIGIKPFYYFHDGKRFGFASEIKAILASKCVTASPDMQALFTPTRYQVSPFTGFNQIRKLPPAHCLFFRSGLASLEKYWSPHVSESNSISEKDAINHLDELLTNAVDKQMIADVPVGLLLSGGLDSSIIGALMRKRTTGPIHSFSIRFSDADQRFERMPDDSRYAKLVAQDMRFAHHECEIKPDVVDLLPRLTWHLDEPLSDPAAINTYLISKLAREHGIVVTLNGMGGDEVFGGYRKHIACLHADLYQAMLPNLVRRQVAAALQRIPVATSKRGLRTIRWAKRFSSFASLPRLERYLVSDLSLSPTQYRQMMPYACEYVDTHYYKTYKGIFESTDTSYLTRMCFADSMVFLPEHNLTYSDKAAMAVGVESRPPLTDHHIVEFMFTLPPHFRIRGNIQKYLLRRVAEKYLRKEIIHRPKAPFGSPLRSWIRGPLSQMVGDLLSPRSVSARGLYDPNYVSTLIEQDRNGMSDNAHIIWTLLSNEVWFRTFFTN